MMLPLSNGESSRSYIRWGSLIRELSKRYTQQEIENMTLYFGFVVSGLAYVPEDGVVRMDADKKALYGM